MISRFFCPVALESGARVVLPDEAAHHAARVLRLNPGDALVLFNGDGIAWPGTIEAVKPEVAVRLGEHGEREAEPRCAITLVQALAAGDKMDWVVQKAAELGAAAIQPVAAQRSVLRLSGARAQKRVDHWRKVVQSACEQSGRSRVPAVEEIMPLDCWLARSTGGWVLSPEGENALRERAAPPSSLNLLIGPEAGWSDAEVAAMSARGFALVRLGPRVLRSETAGLAALAAIQALWGDC